MLENRTHTIKATTLAMLLAMALPTWSHELAPSELEDGEPLIVDAPSGLNLRPLPNSGVVGVIPDKSTIFATGPAERHRTGRAGLRYWAPVRFQAENGEWISGWVLLKHTSTSASFHESPTNSVTQIDDRIIFTEADDRDGVEKAVTQEPAPVEAQKEAAETAILTVRVSSVARLRAGPGTRHGILSRLTNETKVKILGKPLGNWIPVSVEGTNQKGWMHISLLTAQGAFNPFEIAQDHEKSAEEARSEITASLEDGETEAGFNETCDGSPGCRNSGKSKIAVGEDEDEPVSGKGYVRPVSGGRISSNFGRRKDPLTGQGASHGGLDFAVPVGTSVKASRSGTVVQIKSGCNVGNRKCGGGWGNHVIVDHGNGIRTVYAHLSSVNVSVGERVDQNEIIAKSGNSGRTSGPNMHLEVHKNGIKQNPRTYLGI